MCRRETAWESRYCRNAKRSPFVCVLVWVYFEHERFESGFRDLTLCVKVLRACLPQEPQSHNEAQDLLLLQDYVCKLTCTLRTLEDTHALLQQTELLAGVLNEQDCRDIRTACCCIRSLRIRVEARANVTEREVISRQLQLMQASVQHYPTEDLNTADTSCLSRTSAEHFDDQTRSLFRGKTLAFPVSM